MRKHTLCAAALLATLSLAAPVLADQAGTDGLEQQLVSDGTRPPAIQTADLFGPSDEEKAAAAAAAAHEQSQDANIATLNQRASDLEDQIRKLTGQIEVLNHRLDEMDQRMDRMKKDFDYKLCSMSAQQLGTTAAQGDPSAVPCPGAATGAPPPAAYMPPPASNYPPPNTSVTHLAPPPGVLGTLPQQDAANLPTPQPSSNTPPPPASTQVAGNDAHAQFEAAMNMLAKSQYDEASAAFRTFADINPKDPLAPQAFYWVGDIAYVQKDYPTAARAFAESLKKYPTSTRAPESMLKLGQSLIAMNQKDEGCTALHALAARYPAASKTVLSQAEAVRRAGGCSRR